MTALSNTVLRLSLLALTMDLCFASADDIYVEHTEAPVPKPALHDPLPSLQRHSQQLQQKPSPWQRTTQVEERDVADALIVTTRLEAPHMMLRTDSPFLAGNERFEGFLADLIRILALNIGFEYSIRLVNDGRIGRRGPNNTWTGMLGEIHREEADIAAAPLTVTPARAKVVTFTRSYMTLRSCALLRDRTSKKRRRITTARKLVESRMKYGALDGSVSHMYLRSSTKYLHRRMWSAMAKFWPPALVHSVQEGVQRVRRRRYALITDCPMAEYLSGQEPCDLYSSEAFLPPRHHALAMRHGDRLIPVINDELQRLEGNGELERMRMRWWRSKCAAQQVPPLLRDAAVSGGVTVATQVSPWQSATIANYSFRHSNKSVTSVTSSAASMLRTSHRLLISLVVLLIIKCQ